MCLEQRGEGPEMKSEELGVKITGDFEQREVMI